MFRSIGNTIKIKRCKNTNVCVWCQNINNRQILTYSKPKNNKTIKQQKRNPIDIFENFKYYLTAINNRIEEVTVQLKKNRY